MAKSRKKRKPKTAFDEKLSVGDIIFIVQFWHQRDRRWGKTVTEEELVAADVGIRMRRKMLRVWPYFDQMLTPGQYTLEPGDRGIGVPKTGSRR